MSSQKTAKAVLQELEARLSAIKSGKLPKVAEYEKLITDTLAQMLRVADRQSDIEARIQSARDYILGLDAKVKGHVDLLNREILNLLKEFEATTARVDAMESLLMGAADIDSKVAGLHADLGKIRASISRIADGFRIAADGVEPVGRVGERSANGAAEG